MWRQLCSRKLFGQRNFHKSSFLLHKKLEKPSDAEKLKVTFITPENEAITLDVKAGSNLLDIAHGNDIELEGSGILIKGACEGSLACSTCHLIVRDQEYYDKLEEPSDEENDMLDLAFGLTETYLIA